LKTGFLITKLLVNADDFGLSSAINAGIIRSHRDGIVTSTSLVASGAAFDEAVDLSRSNPLLGIGIHLTLVAENAIAAPESIPTLAPQGILPKTYGALVKGAIRGSIKLIEIERELRAQVEKCFSAGINPTHLDSHQHTHALPLLFPIALRIAKDYKIHGIRIPRAFPRFHNLGANRFLPKCVLCLLGQTDFLLFHRAPCVTTNHFAGLFESGDLTEPSLLRILAELGPGTTELMCHPACNDPSPRYASWNQRRQLEMASLTAPLVKQTIQDLGIQLISYGEI
jgi:predicted glycoside hydrolase/deacetylase ChbG (UPF0249 family)